MTRRVNVNPLSRKSLTATLSAIRQLMHPPPAKRRSIGFTADISDPK